MATFKGLLKTPEDMLKTRKNKGTDLESQGIKFIDDKSIGEKTTAVSQRVMHLKTQKKSSKTRLTKARNCLRDLLAARPDGTFQSKNTIRRQINTVNSEFNIVEKIICALKESYAINTADLAHVEISDIDTIIETLDTELGEIGDQVDESIQTAQNHLKERLERGEIESDCLSYRSSSTSKADERSSVKSKSPSEIERARLEAQAANERLIKMQEEQQQKQIELERRAADLELAKQRTEEARKLASLSEARASNAEQNTTFDPIKTNPTAWRLKDYQTQIPMSTPYPIGQKIVPVKLKGVELPIFSGEDKADYESWKAAFMSIVDRADLPVSEKMLRLQNCLSSKAQKIVKDLGYSENAYEKAKSKLEKKYGGERRLQIKHLTALRGWHKVKPGNLEDMEEFLAVLERVTIALEDSGPGVELTGHNLNLTAKEKLSEEDIQSYKHWLIEHSEEDTLSTLVKWIEIKVQVMEEAKEEAIGIGRKKYDKADERKVTERRDDKRRTRGFSTASKQSWKCIVASCGEAHPPWTCKAFKSLSVPERKELIVKNKRCFRCLAAGHFKDKCPNARRCGVDGCNSNQHSSYLHEATRREPENAANLPPGGATPSPGGPALFPYYSQQNFTGFPAQPQQMPSNARTHVTQQADRVSLMVLPAIIVNGSRRLRVNVMLDPCSTESYVTEAAAGELMLQGESHSLVISGTGGSEIRKNSRLVNVTVANVNSDFSANLQANVLDNITSDTPAFEWSKLKEKWPHLKSVPFQNMARRQQIDALIGSDHPAFHHVLQEIHGSRTDDPVARLTYLGWVCFGPTSVEQHRDRFRSHHTRTFNSCQSITTDDTLLRQFWELDAIGIKDTTSDQTMNAEEKAAVSTTKETLHFSNGRYSVGIPWRKGEPKLTNNYDLALTRLESQERSLKRKGSAAMQAYNNVIEDYEKKGYVKKVEKTVENNQWFLPHFAVIKEDRETTKIRIVFDAAVKSQGKSLNDAISPGPKLQRDLTNVLMRFRRAPVAISGDVSEMFLQVCLLEKDRRYHRFLWRNYEITKEPEVYEFQRLVFGNTASPFCSQFVIHSHAKEHASDYPEAADTVDNSMYVDDVLDSCEDADKAKQLRRQLSELLSSAGFHLRKWSSNDASVIEDIPENDRLPSLEIQDGQPTCKVKTLGVLWKAQSDVFTFSVKVPEVKNAPTKREVLRAIATLFDPLQFLSPFTVRAKILLQELWSTGLEWDEPLPHSLSVKWKNWVGEVPQLSNFEIPRCLRQPKPIETLLHMFSDASKDAYAAVAYLACAYEDYTRTSRLIASKSRVAPLKVMTIPRLELMGAVISTRLANSITKSLKVDRIIYWTDSTNVLYWIRNKSRNFKSFVANRISEIHSSTEPEQWRHVPGDQNPADLPTRGITSTDLIDSKRWKDGPEFLKYDEATWPSRLPNDPDPENESLEVTRSARVHVTEQSDEFQLKASDFSNFQHLLRVTGWVLRFVRNCRRKELRVQTKRLSVEEVKKAEVFWLKRAQKESFHAKGEKTLENLNPTTDEDGLLRINGRLRNADLPYDSKYPIILPKEHSVTRLVIRTVHERLGHGSGVDHTLTELRSRFWVVKGRRLVREVINKCPACRLRFTAKPVGQMMAPLPRPRVTSSMRAFERVGIDYGGPFLTKQGRGKARAKRYLCLFTCLTTRAVHLEMSYSLDTDSFINAFTRMTSRRGIPSYVVSDNGSNFVAAERELRELIENLDQDKIAHETSRLQQIDWKFNPPLSPHFGGVFEAMIKSSKKAIKSILSDADITDEELHTAICGAEQLLNSRPITYVSADANDLCPLTPNHFIVGQMGGSFAAEACENEEAFNPRKRWHRVQQLIGQVWKRWRRELLPVLNTRKKWFHPQRNLSKGDVVMIIEPNASRGEWPLGRVLETFTGSDGLVRVVRVKAKGKEYLRPVHRLCPLEYV